MRDDVEHFQKYFELADLCRLPTIGGWTRKVAEMEQHMARGGVVDESGSFFVQTGRHTDHSADRVIDFFRCLPANRRASALVIAYYCSPTMLDEYPDLVGHLYYLGIYPDGESWTWSRPLKKSAGEYQKGFWRRVHMRRLEQRQKNDKRA